LIELDQEVTWEATHFGIRQRLTSHITAFDRPNHFRDSLVRGVFRRFDHDHFFLQKGGATIMRDVFNYESPFGWLGRLADVLFLRSYMVRLLTRRAKIIKLAAEATSNSGAR
jgi:ligand-binding SRPBCC domain-containing protein